MFRTAYHCVWAKPNNVIGAKPALVKIEIMVCDSCGLELQPTHKSVGDV
jgi:hypothetical protein